MGGMHGFGPVVRERDEPVFHHEWERRTFAIANAILGHRKFNIDEFRQAIERMPPDQYLTTSYYEHWLFALESLLVEKGVVEPIEVSVVMAALRAGALPPHAPAYPAQQSAGATGNAHNAAAATEVPGGHAHALRKDAKYRPCFKAGDRVVARNLNPVGHTRLPRYVRGHRGVIHRDWGVFIFPDTHARGEGTKPQHCYAVEFDARELWGSDHPVGERVYVDLWEDYLEADREARAGGAKSRNNGARGRVAKSPTKVRSAKPARIRAAKKTAPKSPDA